MSPYETMSTRQLETELDFFTNLIANAKQYNDEKSIEKYKTVLAEVKAILASRNTNSEAK